MAEPFVFYFRPGAADRVEVIYLVDLDCQCGLCGHEQVQRFFHSTPFHALTLPGLEDLADRAPLKAGYHCDNCGEAVGANQVRRSVLIYGFADDAGVVRIFDDLHESTRSFEVTARRRLDPQTQPRWTADEDAFSSNHFILSDLHEEDIQELLGRPFNPKLCLRDLAEEALRCGEPRAAAVTSDFSAAAAASADLAAEALEEMPGDPAFDITLSSDEQTGEAHWRTWLTPRAIAAIGDGRLHIHLRFVPDHALATVKRTFEVARLSFDEDSRPGDHLFRTIETPADVTYPQEFSLASVLNRAATTGLTPGEAARLGAEEIVAHLLGLW